MGENDAGECREGRIMREGKVKIAVMGKGKDKNKEIPVIKYVFV